MSTIKNQRCFTEATASARLILATGLPCLASYPLWSLLYPEQGLTSAERSEN